MIGQSRYSTTLLLDGGRLFRVVKSQPSGLAFERERYSLRTTARAYGRVDGAALALLFVGCRFPYHAERRTRLHVEAKSTSGHCRPSAAPARSRARIRTMKNVREGS